MAWWSWPWSGPLVEGVNEIVVAYFCALPHYPYRVVSAAPFRLEFRRGSHLKGWVSGEYEVQDLHTHLTAVFRPTAGGGVEGSLRFDVDTVAYELGGNPLRAIENTLREEFSGFVDYYNGFTRKALR